MKIRFEIEVELDTNKLKTYLNLSIFDDKTITGYIKLITKELNQAIVQTALRTPTTGFRATIINEVK
jgi:hypothetical protein